MKKPATRKVRLAGIRPIMFDRYPGDNKSTLAPEQKMYFGEDGKALVVPSANVHSFLCAENTKSAVKLFYDPRQYKRVAQALLGFVAIEPFMIPLTRKGKRIRFGGFGKGGIWLHRSVARLANGVPNPKERPVVDDPWELDFELTVYPNDEFNETDVRNLFERGGIAIGLGTYRGVFGKFIVETWA